jgi:hypothetical protein
MRLLGGRWQKVLYSVGEIPQSSRGFLITNCRGGTLREFDICARKAKRLPGESKRRQRCPSWWRNQHSVMGPVHYDDRAGRIQT